MARKTRKRKDRKKRKQEKRERIIKASGGPPSQAGRGGRGPLQAGVFGKKEVKGLKPTSAFVYTFLFSFLFTSPLIGGAAYILNLGRYTADMGVGRQGWFVIGIGLGALISVIMALYARKRVERV